MLTTKATQFYLNDSPFFYLADTCWSAFTNITESDWRYYLDTRKAQGFNAIQINILRQWDASDSRLDVYPFKVTIKDGRYNYDFKIINEDYFDRAETMLLEMKKRDMIPALVLLWSNYVPDTWAANLAPNNLMPYEAVEPYITYVTKRFAKYNPIYFVSGDTDFPTDETTRYYTKAYETAKSIDPKALYSFHIKGRLDDLPKLLKSKTDFFCYQSGHNKNGQETAFTIPFNQRKLGFSKPIINSEPCYEQISYSRNGYGRYSARDVRQAAWSSVLSGANAGITYGAHGIWSWHLTGSAFGIHQGEGFSEPFPWQSAIHFRGAADMQFLKETISREFTTGCFPIPSIFPDKPTIRIASNIEKTKFILYVPTNIALDISDLLINKSISTLKVIDLNTRVTYNGKLTGSSVINMSLTEEDSLIIINCMEV